MNKFLYDKVKGTIETERLLLRPWKMSDADDLTEGISDFSVAKNLTVPYPYSKSDAETFILKHLKNDETHFYFAIEVKGEGKAIGGTSLVIGDKRGNNGGGIWLAKTHHGKGYGTETMIARARFAFDELKVEYIDNGFFEWNNASKHMQEKVGYKIVGKTKNNCPAMGGENVEIRTLLTKEDFYKKHGNKNAQ